MTKPQNFHWSIGTEEEEKIDNPQYENNKKGKEEKEAKPIEPQPTQLQNSN